MGADFYEPAPERKTQSETGGIPVGIGENCTIRRAIIDKNARIGSNVMIINKEGIEEAQCEEQGYYIRSGIVVVLKNATIPNGTII